MIINIRKFSVMRALMTVAVLAISAGGAGLPGEYLVTDRWRSVYSMYSNATNPAYIAAENHIAVRAAVAPVLEGAFTLCEIGVNVPVSLYQTAGFTMMIEGAGTVYEDTFDPVTGNLSPDMSSSKRNTNSMLSFGYAWRAWQGLAAGANLNYTAQSNFGDPQLGVGIDFGVTYKALRHRLYGNHTLGIATNNVVNIMVETDEKYAAALRFSLLSDFWMNRISYGADFVLKDIFAGAEEFQASVPGQTSFAMSIPWEFNHMLGVDIMRFFKLYTLIGFGESAMSHWGFAFGVRPSLFNTSGIRSVEAVYQYTIMTEDYSDASAHTLFLRMEFGKHREESFAAK